MAFSPLPYHILKDGSIEATEQAYRVYAGMVIDVLADDPAYLAAASNAKTEIYPGRFQIRKRPHLNPAQRAAEAEGAFLVENHTDRMVELARNYSRSIYHAEGVVATDLALSIHPLFQHHLTRTLLHETGVTWANVLRDEKFKRRLDETPDENCKRIALVAGGAGSGKTGWVFGLAESGKYHAIYEHPFHLPQEAIDLAGIAQSKGLEVDYFLMHRDPATAARVLWERIPRGGMTIRIPQVIKGHLFSTEAALELGRMQREEHPGMPKMNIYIMDSSKADSVHMMTIDDLQKKMHGPLLNKKRTIEIVSKQIYGEFSQWSNAARESRVGRLALDAQTTSFASLDRALSPRHIELLSDQIQSGRLPSQSPELGPFCDVHCREIYSWPDYGRGWDGHPLTLEPTTRGNPRIAGELPRLIRNPNRPVEKNDRDGK